MYARQFVTMFSGKKSLAPLVAALFANGELGTWQDPTYLSVLYQEATGITPVTATTQTIGLFLDRQFNGARGAELLSNGDFSGGTTGYTDASTGTGTFTTPGNVATFVGTNASNRGAFNRAMTFVVGKAYEITWNGTGSGTIGIGTAVGFVAGVAAVLAPVNRLVFVATATTLYLLAFTNSGGSTFTLDNISIKEILGSHALQATAAARPLYRTGPIRVDYDAVDDVLTTTFTSSLGSACTVGRSVPGVGASILTGQTIGTSYADTADHCGLVIVNRALTASETVSLTAFLNQKAF